MNKRTLILGGYGGVGQAVAEQLLNHTQTAVVVAGRNLDKAAHYANRLKAQFTAARIDYAYADVFDQASLKTAFDSVDLVVVTTTTPDWIQTIVEAAIATQTDMLDIFLRGDVVDSLEPYRTQIIDHGRIVITQAGFHPGLPAPFIRFASCAFDQYQAARVVMAMKTWFEKPEATHEIIYEVAAAKATLLKNGVWQPATHRDALTVEFSQHLGSKTCYPIQMRELYPLQAELGLQTMGAYVAGFNGWVDQVVFPAAVLLKPLLQHKALNLLGKLMYWGIPRSDSSALELRLEATGLKDGQSRTFTLSAQSDNAFEFTALAVVACLKQYFEGSLATPNLYLMGLAVDPQRIIDDLRQMDVTITEQIG